MALPVTISGIVWPAFSRDLGPFEDGSGNVYFVGYDDTNKDVEVWKATDPTSSFSVQDASNNPSTGTVPSIGAIAAHFDGTFIHVAWVKSTNLGLGTVYYSRFRLSDDTWRPNDEFGGSSSTVTYEVIFTPTDNATVFGVDIAVRSDGDIIVVYHGENPSTMGGTYQEIAYSRWEGSSWTNGVVVASTAKKNENREFPSVVMGSSDQAHIVYLADNLFDHLLRSLSGANALRTERTLFNGSSSVQDNRGNSVAFTQSGTEKIAMAIRSSGNDTIIHYFDHFTDDTNPTFNTATAHSTDTWSASVAHPAGLAVDDLTDDELYIGSIENTSDDVFLDTDAGSVASWSAENSGSAIRAGTGAILAISANIIDRSGKKYAFLYDDNGTIKYDEWSIGSPNTDVTLNAGSFAWSGYDLSVDFSVGLAAGSFAWSGYSLDVSVATNTDVALDAGSFAWSGYDLGIPVSVGVALDAGSFAWSGYDLTISLNTDVALDAGSFAWSGYDLTTLVDRPVALDAGSYAWSGYDLTIDVPAGTDVALDAGSFALSGHDLTVNTDTKVALDAGSFTLSGHDLTIPLNRSVALDTGSYAWSGYDLGLVIDVEVALDAGSYAWSGYDLTVIAGETVALDAGSYAWSGYDLDLTIDVDVALDAGSYAWSGYDLTVQTSGNTDVALDAGSFAWSGYDLTVNTDTKVALDAGSFAWSGHDLTAIIDRPVALDAGSFAWSGYDLDFVTSGDTAVALDAGSFAWSGHDFSVALNFNVTLDVGSFALSGHDLTVNTDTKVALDVGSFAWSGYDLTTVFDTAVALDAGSFAWSGYTMGIEGSALGPSKRLVGVDFGDATVRLVRQEATVVSVREPGTVVKQ